MKKERQQLNYNATEAAPTPFYLIYLATRINEHMCTVKQVKSPINPMLQPCVFYDINRKRDALSCSVTRLKKTENGKVTKKGTENGENNEVGGRMGGNGRKIMEEERGNGKDGERRQ